MYENSMITKLSAKEEQAKCDLLFYQKVYDRILNITIITTRSCNFACSYCAQDHLQDIMQGEIYQRIENFIVRNIQQFKSMSITLFGGEPTLATNNYINFLKSVNEICKFYHKTHSVSMITNGYLLTEEMITELYRCQVTQYTITLDGNPTLHNQYRFLKNGDPTFEVIYKNLMCIIARKDLSRLRVVIRINITKDTIKEIEKWKVLYNSLFDDPRFFIELSLVEDRGRKGDISSSIILYSDNKYKEIKQVFSEQKTGMNNLTANTFVCGYVNKMSLTVDYNGEIRACSKLYMDNIIGYLTKGGQIKVADRFPMFYCKYDTKCYGCAVEPLCHGKRCGFNTICIKDQIVSVVQDNFKKKGIEVCRELTLEESKIQQMTNFW